MNYCKTRTVKSLVRGNLDDAGIDFFVPTLTNEMLSAIALLPANIDLIYGCDEEGESIIRIPRHSQILIPAGVKVIVPDGFALIANNKSGVATKKRLDIGACVIDTSYRGEVHINLVNTSDSDVTIRGGEKIVQFILTKIGNHYPEEITHTAYKELGTTTRGEGGFGSTGI